jgi:protein-S-isoprenylcysteine O-methyltransferase Ste14
MVIAPLHEGTTMTQNLPDSADRPSSIPWPPILIVVVIAGAAALSRVAPLQWPGVDDTAAHYIGLGLGAFGIVLFAYSVLTLRSAGTTTRPHAGASALVTSGPYRRFRNPIYLANCLILFGIAELTKNVWFVIAAFVFGLLVTWLSILPEERYLERRFGRAYLDYKANSRRWI